MEEFIYRTHLLIFHMKYLHFVSPGTHLHIFQMKYLHFGRICTRPEHICTYCKWNIDRLDQLEHIYIYFKWNINILNGFTSHTKLHIFLTCCASKLKNNKSWSKKKWKYLQMCPKSKSVQNVNISFEICVNVFQLIQNVNISLEIYSNVFGI